MVLLYIVPIIAWLAFVYVQHTYGDRPTTVVWMALMTGIGVFEYGKCVFALVEGVPSIPVALVVAFASAGAIFMLDRRGIVGEKRDIESFGLN